MQLPIVEVVEEAVQRDACQHVACEDGQEGGGVEQEDSTLTLVTLGHEHENDGK